MKGIENVLDKVLLVIGVLLLILFWTQFPPVPSPEQHHYAAYADPATAAGTASKWTYLKPHKTLSPHEVIRIQLQALQQNDPSDSGVITVFNFSSPMNKLYIGPLEHFRILVRDPAYSTMLNFRSYKTGQLIRTGSTAYQLVVLTGRDGQQQVYLFILAKQRKGIYKGCWMTEGIARLEPERQSSLL